MATTPSVGDDDDMNASLWGELQNFIDLSVIYAKLPLGPFFCLRQVCKEWNRLASDRQFLEHNFKPPFSSNPYFILTPLWGRHVLLTSEGSSWSSTPVPRVQHEVSGLFFECSNRKRVFDLHTRMFHTLPPLPPVVQENDYRDPMTLMTVDTTVIPYGFKVIIAYEIIGTWIYDSNSGAWTHKPSTHPYIGAAFGTTCRHYDKSLYIRVGKSWYNRFNILAYDLERDEWACQALETSRKAHSRSDIKVWPFNIDMWQDNLFVFEVKKSDFNQYQVSVWEHFDKMWFPIDKMPRDLCKWMRDFQKLEIMIKFWGEHVLLYNCNVPKVKKAILYNLDRKTWDKIELPTTPKVHSRIDL